MGEELAKVYRFPKLFFSNLKQGLAACVIILFFCFLLFSHYTPGLTVLIILFAALYYFLQKLCDGPVQRYANQYTYSQCFVLDIPKTTNGVSGVNSI